jgi:hypothetical protein
MLDTLPYNTCTSAFQTAESLHAGIPLRRQWTDLTASFESRMRARMSITRWLLSLHNACHLVMG